MLGIRLRVDFVDGPAREVTVTQYALVRLEQFNQGVPDGERVDLGTFGDALLPTVRLMSVAAWAECTRGPRDQWGDFWEWMAGVTAVDPVDGEPEGPTPPATSAG
jgi:hypothetical protein